MTDVEKLVMLKNLTSVSDTDEVLSACLKLAGSKILERVFPYKSDETEVPSKYHYLQIQLANYILCKRGAEGQTAHTENGITRQYENADIPESMLRGITPYCGVIK